MKTITIRLPDVEAAMLAEARKRNKCFNNLQSLLIDLIKQVRQSGLMSRSMRLNLANSLAVGLDHLAK